MVCLVGVWYAKEKKNIMREYVRFPGTERYLGIDWGGVRPQAGRTAGG